MDEIDEMDDELGFDTWCYYDGLDSDRDIAAQLDLAIVDNDAENEYVFFLSTLACAAKAREINETAKNTGVPRESLYDKEADYDEEAEMSFKAVHQTLTALGFRLQIVATGKSDPAVLAAAEAEAEARAMNYEIAIPDEIELSAVCENPEVYYEGEKI